MLSQSSALDLPKVLDLFGWRIGEVAIHRDDHGFELRHRQDMAASSEQLQRVDADLAKEVTRFDDWRSYRPLTTVPNLRHGWRIHVRDATELQTAIDAIYPGRLAVFQAWKSERLTMTSLRETLNRQSGIYRVAAKITDEQIDTLVGNFCRSNGGCLRTILWKRDNTGAVPSTKLPRIKFDPQCDQTGSGENCLPLLCQEPCHLLVNECRKVVKGESQLL